MLNGNHNSPIVILGAGIMGCCLALELAQRGYNIDLIDLANEPMTGASLHNEGKLHLGFVYANDPLKMTHRLMLRGSLTFTRIIERLAGAGPTAFMTSQPFHYFVPVDSNLDLATIEEHFHAVEESAQELTRSTGDLYLGHKLERYFRRNSSREHERLFSPRLTLGSFSTEERSVSPAAVAVILRRAVKILPNITYVGNTTVRAVDRIADGSLEVEASRNGTSASQRYSCVVNCLWDDKIRVDRTLGIHEPGPWIHRYKITIHVPAPVICDRHIPSATGIHGSYGDVVKGADGLYYISWYPLCKIEQSIQADGRTLHDRVHKGVVPRRIKMVTSAFPALSSLVASIAHRKFIKDNIRHMADYIPSMTELMRFATKSKLGGGVILARGCSDIDNPHSQLHQRLPIGPVAYGSYVTVDTGKYTMAPLFATQTADMVVEILR